MLMTHCLLHTIRLIIITMTHHQHNVDCIAYLDRAVSSNHSIDRTLRERIKSPMFPSHEVRLQQIATHTCTLNTDTKLEQYSTLSLFSDINLHQWYYIM